MSDRLNLWPEPAKWAEVNISDHASMVDAVKAFANHEQVLNVYGPKEAIEACKAAWKALESEDVDFPPSSPVTWVIQEQPGPRGWE